VHANSLPLLRIHGLTHGFVDPQGRSQTVLRDFSLEVAAGESVALWGASGSGKTTLLNLVAGLLRPDAGSIVLLSDLGEEMDIARLEEQDVLRYRRQSVGYVFQFFNLIETLTVSENIALSLELAGVAAEPQRLPELGLEDLAQRFPAELSGGEQQRVAVLRALAHKPALVLADEPTGNLDAKNTQRVAELLWEQVSEQKAALLVATHSRAIAERADRIIEVGH